MATEVVGFSPTPSLERAEVEVEVTGAVPSWATAQGVLVGASVDVPEAVGVGRAQLEAAGFDGAVGSALVLPTADGATVVAVGGGDLDALDAAGLRRAAAAFARAAARHERLALVLPALAAATPADAAQAVVEGAVLARYRYDVLRREAPRPASPLVALAVVAPDLGPGDRAATERGAGRGRALASATALARDLANTPHSHLTASRLAELAEAVGPGRGLEVEVFDEAALRELGCGGLLGVNAGSAEPPRMIVLRHRPPGATAHLGVVGKGIMYDSGGLALKPGDEVHAQMKNDMSGAAAVFAACCALGELGCPTAVTAWLMCTDNMPSGTALALGDVITMRGGTTVEVINTDAEGRLVMADALVLATEAGVDAVVDIATLTGACMRALGTEVAGVLGNDAGLVAQVGAAAARADEPVWELPLERRYRKELDSPVADLRNLGGANAGAITAALFLAEFVGTTPWAHVDIAGTAQSTGDSGWQTAGCTGFGARLLAELAASFAPRR